MEIVNHEYYVSPEIAKLLKKAGFDWRVRYMYRNNNPTLCICTERTYRNTPKPNKCPMYWQYAAPTLEVAQRWLREVKGICLTVQPLFDKVNEQFNVVVGFTPFLHRMDGEMIIISLDSEYTYEKALEAGIKKALELILKKKIICQQEKDC